MRTRKPSRASSAITSTIVCPVCGIGDVESGKETRCSLCGVAVEDHVLRTLREIVSLPDALGRHACGCGHPEMRLLPDGVYRCPACGDEILPFVHRASSGRDVVTRIGPYDPLGNSANS